MNRDAVQVLIGMQTNSEYIQEHVQNYELAQWVNKNLEDTSLLFIANDDRGYYFEKNYILGYPIIQGYIDYFEFDSADKLRARLKREGVTHIVLTYHHTSEGTTLTIFNNFYNSCITKIWLDLVEEHGEFIIEKNNVYLYKLV